jgi:ATP-dependent RNA helicase RhlB
MSIPVCYGAMSENHLTETTFDSFQFDTSIQQGLNEAGFTHCTPIQAQTIPVTLQGRDVAGQAQTGTGKTAAFMLATLQHLHDHPPHEKRRPNQPRAFILAPTRELAIQIHKDAELFGKHTALKIRVVYGGANYDKQRDSLAEVDILIGTPGRLIDYFKQRIYDLRALQVLVLDEADRMFDLGFIKDIRYLLRRMPPPDERLGMLFSATLGYRVTELAYEHMNNPEIIKIETESVTADKVRQQGYMVANDEKIPLLVGLMRSHVSSRTIVFVNTKRAADEVWGFLAGNGINSAILSGDVPQKKRISLLNQFQQGELDVLVATDVAARGLHISNVTHVINYDLPQDAEDYVHRIGRTARAGTEGDAISFVCETYAIHLPDIESYIEQRLPVEMPDPSLLAKIDPKSRKKIIRKERTGGHGKRHSRDGKSASNNNSGRRRRNPSNKHGKPHSHGGNNDRSAK